MINCKYYVPVEKFREYLEMKPLSEYKQLSLFE